ncbi:hypothetical protein M422DRAFT_35229 [Sphaerobolus stellatus SS14]|uniref:Uncharacterized protein n=1 Tax=Sphaerobolus stellatus (strain SS14) TaxID=990650 RepID=A0A0C9V9S3_SPHS4|nr:hypothetical protein M422DRAFT_35229 [Sphaerobolus stellatus SS14]
MDSYEVQEERGIIFYSLLGLFQICIEGRGEALSVYLGLLCPSIEFFDIFWIYSPVFPQNFLIPPA